MCLALPRRVLSLDGRGHAETELGGVRQRVSLALLDEVHEGDYVIVHAGFAIGRLDPEEAARTLSLVAELDLEEPGPPRSSP